MYVNDRSMFIVFLLSSLTVYGILKQKTATMQNSPNEKLSIWFHTEEWEQHRNGGVNVPCHSRSFSMGRRDERHSLKVLYVQQQSL